jgi:hypothetical protein
MKLYCAFCAHIPSAGSIEAYTVINGQAVCYDHMGIAQGGDFSIKLGVLLREARSERP